jgi:hypothetical protein
MSRLWSMLVLYLLIAACSQQAALDDEISEYRIAMPVDFSGSWERDYSRGEDINSAFNRQIRRLSRMTQDTRFSNNPHMNAPSSTVTPQDAASFLALARLTELITKPDVLTITQNEHEISVARKGDFAMLCEFYDGIAKGTLSDYGTEVCGWDGSQLVSHLILPDGLQISHRFAISDDAKYMRVTTTASSRGVREPFTLDRFYMKFTPATSEFNCLETLSMKRVCSTGEIVP